MSRFACNFHGWCESDSEGEYDSVDQCEQACQSAGNVDSQYLTFQYALEEALHLAPSDQVEVIKRLVGVSVPRTRARQAIRGLVLLHDHDPAGFALLVSIPAFHSYLSEQLPTFNRKAVIDVLVEDASLASVRFLLDVMKVDLLTESRVEEARAPPNHEDDYKSYLFRIAEKANARLDTDVLEALYQTLPPRNRHAIFPRGELIDKRLEDWYFAHPNIIEDLLGDRCPPIHITLRAFPLFPDHVFRMIFDCADTEALKQIYKQYNTVPSIALLVEQNGLGDDILDFLLSTDRYDKAVLQAIADMGNE